MIRSMMQVYIKGSYEAVKLYQRAFGAKLVSEYKNDDGSYLHAELDVFGQTLAISEAPPERVPGNTMEFCFHFKETEIKNVKKAYEILKYGAVIHSTLGPCFYSQCMFRLIDKFGVNWCLFI